MLVTNDDVALDSLCGPKRSTKVTLEASWAKTASDLARAASHLGSAGPLDAFEEYLAHNELELAAEVLAELGDEHGMPSKFWEAMASAYETMQLDDKAKRCRLRMFEGDRGFIEARLVLTPTSEGGRAGPVLTDHRASWDLGHRTLAGDVETNDARISLEDCLVLPPGGTATIGLHPLVMDAFRSVTVGAVLPMLEGSRVVGRATVARAALRLESVRSPQKAVLTIDGARFHDLDGFYDEVSTQLIPGADWGRNLDAFNDILRGGFGTPQGGFILTWVNAQISRATLGHAETARWLETNKLRCHPENVPRVEEKLARARRGEGETLFDILVDIIRTHGPGGDEHEDAVDLVLA
jgi:RNAse (barnase) inhibitor barstar